MTTNHSSSLPTGTDIRAAVRLARLLTPTPVFRAHLAQSPARAEVEDYIAQRFEEVHGAIISDFMPILLTMGCAGNISAATGLRTASQDELFLEQYLHSPVEQVLAPLSDTAVPRSGIAEIGNLVASRGGASYLLFMVLTAILDRAGFEWVVFTATPQVQKALAHLGLDVHRLCAADPTRLADGSASRWGRYYATEPQVVAGNVTGAMAVLTQRPLYAGALALFRRPIHEMAALINRESTRHGTYRLTA